MELNILAGRSYNDITQVDLPDTITIIFSLVLLRVENNLILLAVSCFSMDLSRLLLQDFGP